MKRRDFMTLLVSTAAAAPLAASAQSQAKVYRVGLLSVGPAVTENSRYGVPLIHGLVQHGYIPGTNLAFETLSAEGYPDRLPRLVSELVARKVDVIVTFGYPPALAAKRGTKLPVVLSSGGDPVGTGLVASSRGPVAI
jgi:putative ABC transport system substrate-binding protein